MPIQAHSLLAFFTFATLVACGNEPSVPADQPTATATPTMNTAVGPGGVGNTIAYECLPAQRLIVSYDNSRATPTATLTLDGATFELTRVEAASGAKYATNQGRAPGRTLVWWTQGDDGTLYEGILGGTAIDEERVADCNPA